MLTRTVRPCEVSLPDVLIHTNQVSRLSQPLEKLLDLTKYNFCRSRICFFKFQALNSAAPTMMATGPGRVQKKHSTSSGNSGIAHPSRESSLQFYKPGTRSCRACHQRKVRCDRGAPCTNCSRSGITCVYPTKDRAGERKSPTLQSISDRLERLETLLSRLSESSQVATGSVPEAYDGGGGSHPGIPVPSYANANAIETPHQPPSDQPPCKSTWELLLSDEQVVRFANNSNIEILLRDVSIFASLLFFFFLEKGTSPTYPGRNSLGAIH